MRRRRAGNDDGASLVLVLLIVTTIATVMGVVLSQTDTSVRATLALRDQAGSAYNADAAAQVAINAIRTGCGYSGTSTPLCTVPNPAPVSPAFNNGSGTSCFGPTATQGTMSLQDFYPATNGQNGSNASSAAVVCNAEAGTGVQGSLVPFNDLNKPGNAILTLGTDPSEDGLNVKALAKNSKNTPIPFNVHGSIISNSNINVVSGSVMASAAVLAHTGCVGTISSTPPPVCNAATAADPNYAKASATVPTYQTVPTACPGNLVTFLPGYYDDAIALSNLMSGVGSCKNSVWWFKPGTYYFDFHNGTNPLLPAGSDVWLIKNGTLIAGTPCATRVFPDPVGNPNSPVCVPISQPIVQPTLPGACQFPTETTNSAAGVQFIFGGDSQLQFSGGGGEICGDYASGSVSPVIYGVKSGSESAASQNGLTLTSPANNAGNFTPTNLTTLATNLIASTDGLKASWTSTKNNDSTTLTVSGFSPAAIPAGSVLTSAAVRVTHKHNDTSKADTLTAVVTPTGGSALTTPPTGRTNLTTYGTDSLAVDAAGTGSLAQMIHSGTFTGAKIALTVNLAKSGSTEDIDSIKLDLTYTPPAYRGETTAGCLAPPYTGTGTTCAVFSTTTSYAGALYIEGMVYTPAAVVDVSVSNVSQQMLRFGVVARSLFIKESGSLNYEGPLVYLPDNSPGYGIGGTNVELTVYVCPAVSTAHCETDSSRKLALTVRLLVYDPTGVAKANTREITILSWSMRR